MHTVKTIRLGKCSCSFMFMQLWFQFSNEAYKSAVKLFQYLYCQKKFSFVSFFFLKGSIGKASRMQESKCLNC